MVNISYFRFLLPIIFGVIVLTVSLYLTHLKRRKNNPFWVNHLYASLVMMFIIALYWAVMMGVKYPSLRNGTAGVVATVLLLLTHLICLFEDISHERRC